MSLTREQKRRKQRIRANLTGLAVLAGAVAAGALLVGGAAYRISQEDYAWWAGYVSMYGRYQDELTSLKEQYGADAVDDIISRPELSLSDDYNAHERELRAQLDAVRFELGEA